MEFVNRSGSTWSRGRYPQNYFKFNIVQNKIQKIACASLILWMIKVRALFLNSKFEIRLMEILLFISFIVLYIKYIFTVICVLQDFRVFVTPKMSRKNLLPRKKIIAIGSWGEVLSMLFKRRRQNMNLKAFFVLLFYFRIMCSLFLFISFF